MVATKCFGSNISHGSTGAGLGCGGLCSTAWCAKHLVLWVRRAKLWWPKSQGAFYVGWAAPEVHRGEGVEPSTYEHVLERRPNVTHDFFRHVARHPPTATGLLVADSVGLSG